MKIKEELLDEENEKILNRLDNMIGLSKNKEVLRNIIRFSKLMKKYEWKTKYENYNIVIRNESAYNLYEELINLIAEIYYKNGIILNPEVIYFDLEKIDLKNLDPKKIEQGIIVINFSNQRKDLVQLKKVVNELTNKLSDKVLIVLEEFFCLGEVNAILNNCVSWSMRIESISKEEKEQYVKKFMDSNHLIYNNEIIKDLSKNPYWKIKNDMINIFVNCKIRDERDVSRILKNNNDFRIKKEEKNKKAIE